MAGRYNPSLKKKKIFTWKGLREGARVSEFFYYEYKLKIKIYIFSGGGGGDRGRGARVSDFLRRIQSEFFLQRIQI